jgi:hypothetical protein
MFRLPDIADALMKVIAATFFAPRVLKLARLVGAGMRD